MKKILFLTMTNIRSFKFHNFLFTLLLTLATCILSIGIIFYSGYSHSLDSQKEKQNIPDVYLSLAHFSQPGDSYQQIQSYMDLVAGSSNYKIEKNYLLNNVTYQLDKDIITEDILLQKLDPDMKKNTKNSGIYLPAHLRTTCNVKQGDTLSFKIDNQTIHCKVAGFVSITSLIQKTDSISTIYMSDTVFNQLSDSQFSKNIVEQIGVCFFNVPEKNHEKLATDISSTLPKDFADQVDFSFYSDFKSVQTYLPKIISATCIFSFCIIILVCIFLLYFHLHTIVLKRISHFGILKTMGYTDWEILLYILLQYLVLGSCGIGLGIFFALFFTSSLYEICQNFYGYYVPVKKDVLSIIFLFAISLSGLLFYIFIFIRKIKNINAVTALRGGIETHNFQTNPFSFHKTPGSVLILMGLKDFFHHKKQTVLLFFITLLVTFDFTTSAVLIYNSILKPQNFAETFFVNAADMEFIVSDGDTSQQILNELQKESFLNEVYFFEAISVFAESESINVYISNDFYTSKSPSIYQGRAPIHDNETAISAILATKLKKDIGDTVTFSKNKQKYSYIITGLYQAGDLGMSAELSIPAYVHLSSSYFPSQIYATLKNKTYPVPKQTVDVKLEILREKYKDRISTYNNFSIVGTDLLATYQQIILIVCTATGIFSLLFFIFITYLFTRAKNVKQTEEDLLLESLGYPRWKRKLVKFISFIPSIVLGSSVSTILTGFFYNMIFSYVFQLVGIVKLNFELSPVFLFCVWLSSILICSLITWLISSIADKKRHFSS